MKDELEKGRAGVGQCKLSTISTGKGEKGGRIFWDHVCVQAAGTAAPRKASRESLSPLDTSHGGSPHVRGNVAQVREGGK